MPDSFDPYHKWLGILPKDQPPHHYRLLAIELFENDPDVIEAAADRQMSHLRGYQTGKHSSDSQKLLNECAAARVTLLNSEKKAEYDARLKAKLARDGANLPLPPNPQAGAAGRGEGVPPRAVPRAKPLPQAQPTPPASAPLIDVGGPSPSGRVSARRRKKKPAWLVPAAGVGGAIVFALVIWIALRPSGQSEGTNRQSNATNSPKTTTATTSSKSGGAIPVQGATPPPSSLASPTSADSAPDAKADFEILSASWGAGDKWVDVTEGVRGLVTDNRLMMTVSSDLFCKSEDPAPGGEKRLNIRYRCREAECTASYLDSWFVYLDGNPLAPPIASPASLELLEARYGAGGTFTDVLPQLRGHLHNGWLSVAADEFAGATTAELEKDGIGLNIAKVLWVRYRNDIGESFTYAWGSDLVVLDSRLPPTAGPPTDLIQSIDLKRDAQNGAWKLADGVIEAPRDGHLQLPIDAPEDYMLAAITQRDEDGRTEGICIILPVDGTHVLSTVDGHAVTTSGLTFIHGAMATENASRRWRFAPLLAQARPNRLVYFVHPTSVRILRDGAEIVRWSGDPRTLSIHDAWRVPKRLALHSWVPFRLSKLELVAIKPEQSPMLIVGDLGIPVDALAAIDLDRDRLHGDWHRDGQALISSDADPGLLQLPAVLPADYQLDLVAARESGSDFVSLTLPVGGAQARLLLDGFRGKVSGLETIDKKPSDTNETKYEGEIFADGKQHAIRILVQKSHVLATVDGKVVVDWTGDVARLEGAETCPYKDRVYVGTSESRYRFTKIGVTALTSESNVAVAGNPRVPSGENGKYLDVALAPGVTMRHVKIPASEDGKIKAFYLGETEVTQKQWVAVMGSNPASHKGDDLPVEDVDQAACIDFCAALERVANGVSFRLPTEAEWMHAYMCNADSAAVYPAAQKFCGWSAHNCDSTQPVGKLPANPFGLFDMVGNVFEWTSSKAIVYGGSYGDRPTEGSVSAGGYANVAPAFRSGNTGFRVAAEAIEGQEATPPRKSSDLASQARAQTLLSGDALADTRRAVPQGKELTAAEKQVADKYDAQWKTAQKLAERLALVRKVYDEGVQTSGNAVLRYALLREAGRRATELGDAATACDAIDQLGRDFQIDAQAEKLTVAGDALKKAQSPNQVWTLALRVLTIADGALVAERYDEARKLVDLITLAGRRLRRNDLTKYAERRLALVRSRDDWHKRVDNALARLKEQPDDPDANLTAGVGLCLLRGDWRHGLPLLARSDDKRMVEIARLEAAAGQDVASRPALIEAWMAVAPNQSGAMRTEYELQAKYWLGRGLPDQAPTDSAHKRALDKLAAMAGVSVARLKPGLDMAMFNGADFEQFRARRVAEGVCHNFGFDGPHPDVHGDGFSVRWTGWIKPPLPGKYVIQTNSDDGCRLRINGNPLIDHWHRGAGEERAEVELTDQLQPFTLEFNDTGATASVRVAWALKDFSDFQLVPAEALYYDPANVAEK